MIALPDINVLIARADPAHVFHERVVSWMGSLKNASIATCPIKENGFLRIFGNPIYLDGPASPAAAVPLLAALRKLPQHVFLADDISLGDTARIPTLAGVGHSQLTNLYLLALAARHSAIFATFDRRIDPATVVGGIDALRVIP